MEKNIIPKGLKKSTCENCKYYAEIDARELEQTGHGSTGGSEIGWCLRFPPVLHSTTGKWVVPVVRDDYACGEFKSA